jgi:transcriptional regulator with XRE-family HTH domain
VDADTPSSFGALLREYRRNRALSQDALAERSGLSREAISLLERGLRTSPRRDTVSLLARSLHLSADERTRLLAAASERRVPAMAATPERSGATSSLPLRLTSFIGREREIDEIRALLRTRRLVTLSGTGGIGKTSLALAVAAEVQDEFSDGVALVDLAASTDGL